jgi:flagellar basal body rod protein FlgF
LLDVVEVFLADLLALGGIEIKLVEALVQELVRAEDGLLQLREPLREAEVVDVRERTRGRSGRSNNGGRLEELKLCEI